MKTYNVGLVGVGAVGTEMIRVLKERNFPCGKVQVFASRERDEQILGGREQLQRNGYRPFRRQDGCRHRT